MRKGLLNLFTPCISISGEELIYSASSSQGLYQEFTKCHYYAHADGLEDPLLEVNATKNLRQK